MTFASLKPGQSAAIAKTITETDVYTYAGITGDFNPVHVNACYAAETRFKTRIAHGILSAGLISAVIGTKLPGPGAVYMGQTLKFLKPVKIGDTITASAMVKMLIPEKKRVILETTCFNQDKEEVLSGEAIVYFPD